MYLAQFDKTFDICGNKRIVFIIVDKEGLVLDTGYSYSKRYLSYIMEDYSLNNENLQNEIDLLFAEEVK